MTLALPSSASAEFGIAAFDGSATADAGGTSFTQAGGHPYALSTTVDFNTRLKAEDFFGTPIIVPWPEEAVKNLFVDVPPGLIGNPTAVSQCTMEQLATRLNSTPLCPAESQVGVLTIRVSSPLAFPTFVTTVSDLALYSIVPPENVPARFGFNLAGVVVVLDAELRSNGDYGLSVNARNTSEGLAILGTDVTFWGTPADPAHDAQRQCPGEASIGCTSTGAQAPFLTMPTACTAPGVGLPWVARTDSWFDPGDFKTASFVTHEAPFYPVAGWPGAQVGITGCDQVPFDGSISAKPRSSASPGPSGFEFELTVPQEDDPITGFAPSHLKRVTVTLPEGVRVSPSSADGLEGCSSAQIGLDSLADPSCPDGSKIGSVTIETPLLEEPLIGSVYLATPFDNPSRSLIAIYLVAKGPGVIVKLPGGASPNSNTGQIVATFDDLPQLPFEKAQIVFNEGPRAPFANPPRCGTYTTRAVLESWSGKSVISNSSFTTSHDGKGQPCPPAKFSPSFAAGTINSVAGASSPFSMTLSRDDDDDEFAAIRNVDMPNGLLARIASLDALCPQAQAAAGTCGEESRIGTVTTAAGPGPHPFAVSGRVHLGGPYAGAPFSLSIAVPVKAGPFDLGTVVVRSAIFVDRRTADLDIVTDPLPTVLQGIPLQVRVVNVLIDRPGFMLNPTGCSQKRIRAEAVATTGRVANLSARFQVGNCAALELNPRISFKIGGKGHTRVGNSTRLVTTLRMPAGGTNLKAVRVTLPTILNARLPVIENACTLAQFNSGDCEDARAGTAVARTPLLKDPLRGGAYFVENPDRALPDLIVALRGQVDFDLIGEVSVPAGGRLATRFPAPDVPISTFTLRLTAGAKGPIGVASNLCSRKARRATVRLGFRGQNGDVVHERKRLKIGGCR